MIMRRKMYDYFVYIPKKWFLSRFIILVLSKCLIAFFLNTALVMVALLLNIFWWIAAGKLAHEWRRYYSSLWFWSMTALMDIFIVFVCLLIVKGG